MDSPGVIKSERCLCGSTGLYPVPGNQAGHSPVIPQEGSYIYIYNGLLHNSLIKEETVEVVLRAGDTEVQGMMGRQRNKMAT